MLTRQSSQPSQVVGDRDDESRPLLSALRRLGRLAFENGSNQEPRHGTMTRTLRQDSNAERHILRFIEGYLRPGDTVLDIGANSGAFAIAAARIVGPPGRVDAFEPSPALRSTLVENIAGAKLKSVIVVHALMVGPSAGLGRFVDGTSRSGRRRPPLPGELATRVIGVEQVRLDQFIGKRKYALMRLDIAGCELNALRGAETQLKQANPPALLVSFDPTLADFGATPEILSDWLDDRGYEVAVYDGDRNLLEYPEAPWRQRRIVLGMARSARNFILRRLADNTSS